MSTANDALKLHRKHRGKISIAPKMRIRNKHDLSLVYTPGVGAVSSRIAEHPEELNLYTNRGNLVAIITDGSAVLGLGNIGPEAALPVMEGKSVIYKQRANIDAVPICLGTQNPAEIATIVKALEPTFAAIQLEDISAPRCFAIETELQKVMGIPVVHDDQHATAMVIAAALENALKIVKKQHGRVRVVISGAGAAGVAAAKLLLRFGVKDLVLVDSRGAVVKGRADLTEIKIELAKITNPKLRKGSLAEVLVGADVFIGVSAPNIVTTDMVESMASKPIIFALANPVPEIMPDVARKAGAAVVATGRSDFPNQINNALVYPGLFRGLLDTGAKRFTSDLEVAVAKTLAKLVSSAQRRKGIVVPSFFDRRIVPAIVRTVTKNRAGIV